MSFCTFNLVVFSACNHKLTIPKISYHSVRTEKNLDPTRIPKSAEIIVLYNINDNQELDVYVKNLTNEIMQIDQTTSFYVDPTGTSISYYDPTIRTTSTTKSSAGETGIGVNLGAVGGLFGIGGSVGGLLSGINVGGSQTNGTASTISTATTDLPVVSLAPKSMVKMSKSFKITNLFGDFQQREFSYLKNPLKFSVCISYSYENRPDKDKIITNLYLNSYRSEAIKHEGTLNEALRNIYNSKKDCLNEPWFRIHFDNNFRPISGTKFNKTDSYISGKGLIDYK